jgi:chemotaxis protein CheC
MRLNVAALGTFYEMADEGASLAAARLAPMTGRRPQVTGTRLHFSSPDAIRAGLDAERRMGIRARLDGGLEGTVLVLFESEAADRLAEKLLDDQALPTESGLGTETDLDADADAGLDEGVDFRRSAITEASQILTSGFVDGWADVLDTHIRMEAPTYVEGERADDFLTPTDFLGMHSDLALVFTSDVTAAGTDVSFTHYLFPEHESMGELFALRGDDEGIPYEKFQGFDSMATRGADMVAQHLSKMTGIDVGVEVRRVNFVSLDAIPGSVPTERHVSVAFSFDGLPSGYLLFLFSESSARSPSRSCRT